MFVSCIRNDLWALGCTMYQMLSGSSPFKDASEWLIFQRIIARDLKFPDYFSDEARDLIDKLLVSNNLAISSTPMYLIILKSSFHTTYVYNLALFFLIHKISEIKWNFRLYNFIQGNSLPFIICKT